MANPSATATPTASAMRAYVAALFDEMERRLAHQRTVVLQCLDQWAAPAAASDAAEGRRRNLEAALREAIEVLEETKRSFKSKRLGLLREKLAQVLAAGEP